MRRLALVIPLCIQVLVSACGAQTDPAENPGSGTDATTLAPAEGQKVLFERSYVNWEMVDRQFRFKGVFITTQGEVFSYEYTTPAEETSPSMRDGFAVLSEAQLATKHGAGPTLIGTVDRETLLEKFALVAQVRKGTLVSQSLCADSGTNHFVAYLYDPHAGSYSPVLLGAKGDVSGLNTAPQGKELMAWIESLGGPSTNDVCEYSASSCIGQPCPGAEACSDGQLLTASTGDCLQFCQAPSRCDIVGSCSVCDIKSDVCAIDQTGRFHCIAGLSSPPESATCDNVGGELCAGGKEYCRGTRDTGFTCEAP